MLGLFCEEEDSKPPNIHFPFFRDRSKSRSTLTPARQNDAQLMYLRFAELGLEKESILYTRVGIPIYDLNLLIHNPSEYTSNANLMRNPETIAKLVHDQVMEQHTYLSIPTHLADAHMKGDIYIKDREYFSTRDYCATWDLRQILLLGIAPERLGGMHSSAAGPAQHLPVVVNHAAIWLAAAQSSFAGGQGLFYFNTFLAPYMKGLPYKKIKQAAQQLIFTLTQQYVARGGQVIFSSVDLTPGIPKIMRGVPAVLPGGKLTEQTYGDLEDEANQFFNAFMEVMIKGDMKGKGFNFPKPNIVLRKEFMKPEFDESWRLVGELTAKFESPYFENYLNWRLTIETGCSSCCSHLWTASSDEELEEFLSGNMVFGASQMVTPNFGRAAWVGRSDEEYFFAKVDEYLELSKQVILEKKRLMDKLIASRSVPFYTQPKPNGDPLIDMSTREFLLGTIGFEELAKITTGYHLHEREGTRFGIKVLNARLNHVLRHFISNLGFRDKTVALCLLSTGADARDLCSLDIDFVLDAKGKISKVDNYFWHSEHSKDSVAFKTFMSKEASAMLRLYVEQNRKGAKANEPIFVKVDGRRLDPKAIQDQFRDAARKMGLMNGEAGDAQPFRPKRFRHIFRTACGLSRIDQGMTNAMMGHKSDISGSYLSKSKPMFISAYFKVEPLITIYGSDRGGWSELSERLGNLEDKIAMRGQYIDTLEFEIEKLKSTISNLASLVAEKLEDGKA